MPPTLSANPLERHAQHRNEIERQQLVADKAKNSSHHRKNTFQQRTGPNPNQAGAGEDPNGEWTERLEQGQIVSVDYKARKGILKSKAGADFTFYLDHCSYGMRKINPTDSVKFHPDNFKPQVAIEVAPEGGVRNITEDDITFFVEEFKKQDQGPIYRMRSILLNREDWPMFLAALTPKKVQDVVLLLIRLPTFKESSNPIHLRVIRSFLQLLTWDGDMGFSSASTTSSSQKPIFPNLVRSLISNPSETATISEVEPLVNVWIDIAEFILLYRKLTEIPVESVAEPLMDVAQGVLDRFKSQVSPSLRKALNQVIRRSSPKEAVFLRSSIVPTTEEMSVPTWDPISAFNTHTLPVITKDSFPTSDSYVEAHCKLLRADNFSKAVNVIGSVCFDLPAFKEGSKVKKEEVAQDAQYHALFNNIKFLGRVLSRANDFAVAKSYVFSLDAAPRGEGAKPVRWMSVLEEGTLVCITTGLDRSTIDATEMFWGVVSTSEPGIKAHHMVAIHPVQGDFEKLMLNLDRNREQSAEDKSMMIETSVFFTGYRSVMEGLLTFLGPHSAPVPFKEILLAATRTDITEKSGDKAEEDDQFTVDDDAPKAVIKNPNRIKSKAEWHIPQFATAAFRQLVHNSRVTFTFDAGQDESMCKLDRKPILLVQGPPGTGKSFMGARIVETYVRYKQMLSSGEILNALDVEQLPDPLLSTISPSLETSKPNYLGPIVVITYKNHALDEFLLDMKKSGLWEGNQSRFGNNSSANSYPRGCRIVRVGGRSKATDLDPYNLNTLMMSSMAVKSKVAPFRERIGILAKRMERLAKEITHLEKGNVPPQYFKSWLTDEQYKTLGPQQRELWLKGDNYTAASHGQVSGGLVPPTHFLSYLKSDLRERNEKAASTSVSDGSKVAPTGDEADQQRGSVFGDMEKEIRRQTHDEEGTHTHFASSSEVKVSDRFSSTCVSAESIRYAFHPPKCPASVQNPQQIMTLWSLAPVARHQYYAYLIQKSIAEKVKEYLSIQEKIETTVCLKAHAQDEARLELLQQADVIGLTTTGCAMNQALLRALKPRVLVVEEAAEVLESQLIACMSESLSQIVLIGDHYQLKPSVVNYDLEINNHFNTSLFERLTKLIDPILLVEQRRMRPGISSLVRQFYDKQGLLDHASVLTRPFIDSTGVKHYEGALGLQRDAFLWTHEHPEETADVGLSKINRHEVRLCRILAEHLTKQGVSTHSITVITPYLGQQRALKVAFEQSDSSAVRGIHVSTVDLFQGDENDIIIVSLVRTAKLTEFMRLRNRMIVACSRARHAMVIIGNDQLLQQSEHWNEILMNLKGINCVGDTLPIVQSGEKRLLCQDGTTLKLN